MIGLLCADWGLQETSADGKARKSFRKRQVAFLQDRECTPTRTDKQYISLVTSVGSVTFGFNKPTPRGTLVYAFNMGAVLNLHQGLGQRVEPFVGSEHRNLRPCLFL